MGCSPRVSRKDAKEERKDRKEKRNRKGRKENAKTARRTRTSLRPLRSSFAVTFLSSWKSFHPENPDPFSPSLDIAEVHRIFLPPLWKTSRAGI
jgi:hypothetical protein